MEHEKFGIQIIKYPIQLLTHSYLKRTFLFFIESNISLLESKIKIEGEPGHFLSFASLNENDFKFVVSYGHFKYQHYSHTCFAFMISPLFGLTTIEPSIHKY